MILYKYLDELLKYKLSYTPFIKMISGHMDCIYIHCIVSKLIINLNLDAWKLFGWIGYRLVIDWMGVWKKGPM